jgi:hypothetical protein
MTDPNLITSGLSQRTTVEGRLFEISIVRLEHDPNWSLEVVDEEGNSTVWDDLFDSDQAALDEVMRAIRKEGLGAFEESGNVVPFPKNKWHR